MILNLSSFGPTNSTNIPTCEAREQSESRLLAAARSGNPAAFESLCEIHRRRLFNIALRITRNREDAEDALQDSLMKAFVHIKDFQGNSRLFTWMTRIVINSSLMAVRKNRNAREVSADELHPDGDAWLKLQIPDVSPNPEQRYMQSERGQVLRKAIARLSPRVRAVVLTGHLQERSLKETARVLDISIAAAKGRYFHGRAALRKSVSLRAVVKARTVSAA